MKRVAAWLEKVEELLRLELGQLKPRLAAAAERTFLFSLTPGVHVAPLVLALVQLVQHEPLVEDAG